MSIVTFQQAESISARFLALLASMGIHPVNKGRMEAEFLSTTELLDAWSAGLQSGQISDDVLRSAAGIHDFAAKVLAAKALPEFKDFADHLKMIGKGVLPTSLSQMQSGYSEDVSRKLVELYVACLAIHCGHNVELDHPVSSKGDNPDIMLDYGALKWTIAIKAPSSRHGQTLFENIKNAAKQIDASSADRGLVLLNVRDSIDHTKLCQGTFNSVADATDVLRTEIETLVTEIERDRPASDWDPVFAGKTSAPVLFMAQTMARVALPQSTSVPVPIKMILQHSFSRAADKDGIELSMALNHSMQTILEGQPGPPPY